MVLILLLAALFFERLRTGHQILSGILAALLLYAGAGDRASPHRSRGSLAEIVLKAPGYVLLWLFLFLRFGGGLPGAAAPPPAQGKTPGGCGTAPGGGLPPPVCGSWTLLKCPRAGSPYSAAEEVKHSILYMLFSYQGLPHLVLMALIVLAVSLLPVQEEA